MRQGEGRTNVAAEGSCFSRRISTMPSYVPHPLFLDCGPTWRRPCSSFPLPHGSRRRRAPETENRGGCWGRRRVRNGCRPLIRSMFAQQFNPKLVNYASKVLRVTPSWVELQKDGSLGGPSRPKIVLQRGAARQSSAYSMSHWHSWRRLGGAE
jgi:hypothetical protein